VKKTIIEEIIKKIACRFTHGHREAEEHDRRAAPGGLQPVHEGLLSDDGDRLSGVQAAERCGHDHQAHCQFRAQGELHFREVTLVLVRARQGSQQEPPGG